MSRAGRRAYAHHYPDGPAWGDLTPETKAMWDGVAERERAVWTWPQRLVIWVAGSLVCGGAMAGAVGLVWYLVSRW